MLGRLGYLRSATPRRNPSHSEIQEMPHPLPQRPRSAPHRRLGAPLLEHATAPVHGDREVMHDLRRGPLAGRGAVPVRLGPARQGPEHQVGDRGEPVKRHGSAPFANSVARMPKIVRMNLLRRYPITCTLLALVLVSALAPLPPLVDAVSGAPPYDVDLVRPAVYTVLAPLSDALDALTFLSLGRAWWFLLTWIVALSVWGLLRAGP